MSDTRHFCAALGSTAPLAALFSDGALTRAMLEFETAVARAQSAAGVIPAAAAAAVTRAAADFSADPAALAEQARASASLAVPFVAAFTAHVRQSDPAAAGYVHWGVTSQDLLDTALALQLRRARAILAADHAKLNAALRALSEQHKDTLMLGRTLLQPALPITFGLKAAGWYAAAARGWRRLDAAFSEAVVLQFGGAAGTLASLGDRGAAVTANLAAELDLPAPAPWHAHRDRLAALAAALGIYTGSLGKLARDLALLMQFEVAEAAEPGGGSSTMPHKRNPAACTIALAAATRTPALVAAILTSMVQEHERAAGAWQTEWPVLIDLVETCGSALAALAGAGPNLRIDAARMRANLDAAGSAIYAERAMLARAATTGRDAAYREIAAALAAGRPLEQLPNMPADLTDPESYLGLAETFRQRLLED